MFKRGPVFTLLALVAVFAIGCSNQSPTAPQANLLDSLSDEAKLPKVDVCHIDDEGNWVLLNVNGNALDSHLNHGDSLPGENGLDENCVEVDDFVSFLDVNVVNLGELFFVGWTVEGDSAGVTYYVDALDALGTGDWISLATRAGFPGQDVYHAFVVPYFFAEEFRVRAVNAAGDEVISPTVSPF